MRLSERHRHLLVGDVRFASVNDHRALSYIFDEPTRASTISVAARDRLRRWAEYLRSYSFDTVHIPGEDNNFCDLLSRNGCSKAVNTWTEEKRRQQRLEEAVARAAPQMVIVKPHEIPISKKGSIKDMDIAGPDLMPMVTPEHWPMTKRLHEAQKVHSVKTDHVSKASSYPLYVNDKGKIVLPKEHEVTMEVIAICHQGDLVHRSAMNTLKLFRKHYTMQGMGRKMEEEFIKALYMQKVSVMHKDEDRKNNTEAYVVYGICDRTV